MMRWTRVTAGDWLLSELASTRVGLGQGLSVRKLTRAAMQAGYPADEFLCELGRLIGDRLLAADCQGIPARTVCVTLAGYQQLTAIRKAKAAGKPVPPLAERGSESTRYQTTTQVRRRDLRSTLPAPLRAL